jgi:hypothetical protein
MIVVPRLRASKLMKISMGAGLIWVDGIVVAQLAVPCTGKAVPGKAVPCTEKAKIKSTASCATTI